MSKAKAVVLIRILFEVILIGLIPVKVISHEISREKPELKIHISVDDSKPLFQGNVTKIYINITHTNKSRSAASHVVLKLHAPFHGEFNSLEATAGSIVPDYVSPDSEILKFGRMDQVETFSATIDMSIDPTGQARAGHVHQGHLWASMTYVGVYENCTELPTSAELLDKLTKRSHDSFYFYSPDSSCMQPLGMGSGRIKESQLFASSFFKENKDTLGNSPHRARLDGPGYWSPALGNGSFDREQFIQINFEAVVKLKMLALQGKPNSTARVRNVDVFSSADGMTWTKQPNSVKADTNIGDASVLIPYPCPIPIRFLRLKPRSWYNENAVRFEVFGCVATSSREFQGGPSSLGVESGEISDSQMTASSVLDPSTTVAEMGRLNSKEGWCSASSDAQPLYLQVDLGEVHVITGISTQSRNTKNGAFQSVTSYSLGHSLDGVTWVVYQQNRMDKVFLGNLVENSVTKHHLAIPSIAKLVRFQPLTFLSAVCMRVELYGDKSGVENTDRPPFYQRSFVLDANNRRLFVCNSEVVSGKPYCYVREYIARERWIAMDRRIVSLLGFNNVDNTTYGVGANRKSYLRCKEIKCYSIFKESWLKIRNLSSTVLATEIVFVPETGSNITDQHIPEFDMIDDEGMIWGASAVGVHFYSPDVESWDLVARWRAYDLDKCASTPCPNGGTCVGEPSRYTCSCPVGWTGHNCEIYARNECHSNPCPNNSSCVPELDTFTCVCHAGYTGSLCDKVLPPTIEYFDCEGTTNGSNGFHSPYYPDYYNNYADCVWLITSGRRIGVVFHYFYTEDDYDKLYVYDGPSAYSPMLGFYSGVNHGLTIHSTGTTLYLYFYSDGSVTKNGFQATFSDTDEIPGFLQ